MGDLSQLDSENLIPSPRLAVHLGSQTASLEWAVIKQVYAISSAVKYVSQPGQASPLQAQLQDQEGSEEDTLARRAPQCT